VINYKPELFDDNKIGSLIVSYYRSGGHFLSGYMTDIKSNNLNLSEINSLETIKSATKLKNNRYVTGILHSIHPKYYLFNDLETLSKWHVIHLTRNNRIEHFISTFFWGQKLHEQKTQFGHHGTSKDIYRNFVNNHEKTVADIAYVKRWLLEILMSYAIPHNYSIDYSELPLLESSNIWWNPNNYDDITLSDLFVNSAEVEELLNNFKINIIL